DGELRRRAAYEAPKRGRVRDGLTGVDDPPAVVPERREVSGVGGVNGQGDLERRRRAARKIEEFPELVVLEPVRAALIVDDAVWASPGGDGGEALGELGGRRLGPLVEEDGRGDRVPADAGRGDRTAIGADVRGDCHVVIVPCE